MTRPWEELFAGDVGPAASALTPAALAAAKVAKHQQEAGADVALSCVTYDEDAAAMAIMVHEAYPEEMARAEAVRDAQAQGDGGPYHWAQGPQDVPVASLRGPGGAQPPKTPQGGPTEPTPATGPGTLPKKGHAQTVADLWLRTRPNGSKAAVMPIGTKVELTGGTRHMKDGTTWRKVVVRRPASWETPHRQYQTAERGDDGWCNSAYLAATAKDYAEEGFPEPTHEWRYWVESAGALDLGKVVDALAAIAEDPRGPRRAGLRLVPVTSQAAANVVVRFQPRACGNAAGCYYKEQGQQARVDIQEQWFGTMWLSRVFLHEVMGHAAARCYDHYDGAPQYPRPEYSGLMGNWTDQFGDHAWPDEDDIANVRQWLAGQSTAVFIRDAGP